MHINKKDATLISYFLELLETSYVELGEDRREVLRQMVARAFLALNPDVEAMKQHLVTKCDANLRNIFQ